MGFWEAPALTMAKLRARMDREPKPMEKLARRLNRQEVFALTGTDYKRPRPAPSKLLEPWYRKKNFVLSHEGRPRGAALGPRAGRHPGGGL